jgi:hypothetical protein
MTRWMIRHRDNLIVLTILAILVAVLVTTVGAAAEALPPDPDRFTPVHVIHENAVLAVVTWDRHRHRVCVFASGQESFFEGERHCIEHREVAKEELDP